MMVRGYRANSLMWQCAAFEVTHDVGNQILNWMYSLPMAALPPLDSLPNMREDYIGNHWVGRDDMREELFGEDEEITRRAPHGMRTFIQKALPRGEFSFYQTHEKWLKSSMEPPNVQDLATVKKEELKWYKNVTGFRQTHTFALHGDPQTWGEGEWFTMQHSDCCNV